MQKKRAEELLGCSRTMYIGQLSCTSPLKTSTIRKTKTELTTTATTAAATAVTTGSNPETPTRAANFDEKEGEAYLIASSPSIYLPTYVLQYSATLDRFLRQGRAHSPVVL